ncbi:GNAT family N-acetyltransferase [Actinacidiphila sp. bgisy167]|uniref:bifunctional acetate--CoA ligase family protein/GNAT family N-acetyltransferase n=1 Tax=Actinacidiphila sp. bgisy167 TaxID=3413797 RepID=UPI003D764503
MTTPSDAQRDYPVHWEADVVLRDGGAAHVRPIAPDDAERLVSFYEKVSDESKYYRFFAPYPRLSDRDVHRFTHHDYRDRVGLAALVGGEFIATVRYDRTDDGEAEVAFLVQDAHQGRGVASALLEHIAAVARERGIRRFVAEVLPANQKMIKVFTDAGYTQQRSFTDGVVRLELDLEPTERSLAVMRAREQRAEARSVQRLLAPASVAVIGAGRRPGGVGRGVLRNIVAGGYTGRVHAVNRSFLQDLRTLEPEGVPAHRSVAEIADRVDLAVIAVPADEVAEVVDACGRHGVLGLLVISSGYAESGAEGRRRQRALVRQALAYGMRVIGPNAFGVLNSAEDVQLNASLSPQTPGAGRLGLFTQSGAIGIALLAGLRRRGAGLSSFVSAGNRADVSGNDILQFWYDDPATDVALLHLETLGNPRKFYRLARRTAAVKPVVVVKGARHSEAAPPGHAVPPARIPDSTVSALLRQAGVIRTDTVTELLDTGLLLSCRPLPAGPRVAILGNSESLGLLTYDACLTAGLEPGRPLDLTTAAAPEDFRTALAAALADPAHDAVVVTAIPRVGSELVEVPASSDDPELAEALRAAADGAGTGKPVVVVHTALEAMATRLAAVRVPAYGAAERAVKALAAAVGYARWRRDTRVPGRVPEFEDVDEAGARRDVTRLLGEAERTSRAARAPDEAGALATATGEREQDEAAEPTATHGVTLDDRAAAELLARYGIPVRPALPAPGIDAALEAAGRLGYPVALKTTAPHLRHRADLGGVRLDIADPEDLVRAFGELTARLGTPQELCPVVQAMAPRGVDTVVRATVDPAAGAVLSFGIAGAPSELLDDMAHRLVPATDRDVAELVRSIRAAPLLFGWRGAEPVDTGALEELLLRVSLLVDDLPEVVGVELEPVVVAPAGLTVLGGSVRLARPPARTDLGPRALSSF